MQFNLAVVYLIFSIFFTAGLSIYALCNPQGRTTKSFVIASLSAVVWMTGEVVERVGDAVWIKWAGHLICFIGVCALPVAMLVFAFDYCGRKISRKQIVWLAVVPLASWLMLLTNEFHHLFFRAVEFLPLAPARIEYGVYFWLVHLPFCYLLSIFCFAVVLLERQRAAAHYRPQITLLFFALCLPLFINAAGIFGLFGEASSTPLTFPVFFSVMTFAVFRYRFLKSNPIAYETVFQKIQDGVIVLDAAEIITDINPAAARSLGKPAKSIIGTNALKTFAPWQNLIAKYRAAPAALDLTDEIELDLAGKRRFIAVRITPLRNRNGAFDGRIFTLRDVTERKHYEVSLETMAFCDPLTRLANRRRFETEAAAALKQSAKTGETAAILYFDLNRFKSVNDTLGHAVGDELLKYVGARASSVLRGKDLMARLGGDEFAVLLHNCDRKNAEQMISRILQTAERPFKIGEHILTASLSIGAAFFPENGTTVAELLRHADAEMYRTKNALRPQVFKNTV